MNKFAAFLLAVALSGCSGGEILGINSHPSAAPSTPKPKATESPTSAPTPTAFPSASPSATPTVVASASASPSATVAPSVAPSPTATGSAAADTVAQISISYTGGTPMNGSSANYSIVITATNASGQVITGNYTNPITLTSTDTTDLQFYDAETNPAGAILITAPGMDPMLFYNGSTLPPNTMIQAYAQGVSTASAPFQPTQ